MKWLLALVCASLLAVPVSAQDADEKPTEAVPAEKPASPGEDFFEQMMKILPDLNSIRQPAPQFDTTKPVVGIGFKIVDGTMVIDLVLANSAAEQAGLKPEMIVNRVNGLRASEFTLAEMAKILGSIDGEIHFDIEGSGRFSLVKAPIPAPTSDEVQP
ncbi:MAG: hypothetical protein WAT93_04040 [Pontixanthobacter sp.]